MITKIKQSVAFIILFFTIIVISDCAKVLSQQDAKGIRTIYLIRHGDYAPQDDNIPDSVNVLTPLGIAQA